MVELIVDVLYGPADIDDSALAEHAVRWKERAGYAEIVADTGLWQPPDISDFPQVRIEGRADRISRGGHHVSQLAAVAQVEYWAVYGVDPDGGLDWRADFATLTDARHHAARWHRPVTLICTDHLATLDPPARRTASPGGLTPTRTTVPVAPLRAAEPIRPAATTVPLDGHPAQPHPIPAAARR